MHAPVVGVMVLAVMLAACQRTPAPRAHGGDAPRPAPGAAPTSGVPAVAVLPFRIGGSIEADASFRERDAPEGVAADFGEQVAVELGAELAKRGVPVIDGARVLGVVPPPGAAIYDARLGARVARDLGAPLAVIGAISRFVQREGTAWGATAPATVWYQAVLVNAADATVLDRATFEHTQQPLSQNLFELPRFLGGGGRWVTREQMLSESLGETASRLARGIRGAP